MSFWFLVSYPSIWILPHFHLIAPTLQRLLIFQVPNLMSFFKCLGRAKESAQVRGALKYFVTSDISMVRGFQSHAQLPSWMTTPCRLSATAYSIYSQLPSPYLEVFPLSTTLTSPMPWWLGTHLTWEAKSYCKICVCIYIYKLLI
jgi:hypothetical protein